MEGRISAKRIVVFDINFLLNLIYEDGMQEFERRKSNTPKPATSYRKKKVQKEDLPDDTDFYQDPTLALYQ